MTEKREAYKKACEFLSQNDETSLRAAALELRRCLEAVVYEKLWAYRARIPANAARKWQPPQAFRALLAVEPDADQSSVIRLAQEATPGGPIVGPWQTLGTDHRPSVAWLNKTYNKLGGMLHATWPYARHTQAEQLKRDYLEQVSKELERYVTHTLTSTFAEIIEFKCSECGQPIIANERGLQPNGDVYCLDPDCGARYFVRKKDEDFAFELDAQHLNCRHCSASITVPSHKIAIGYKFACKGCGAHFEICSQNWEVRDDATGSKEPK